MKKHIATTALESHKTKVKRLKNLTDRLGLLISV